MSIPTDKEVFDELKLLLNIEENYTPRNFNYFPGPNADKYSAKEIAEIISKSLNDKDARLVDLGD